VVSTVHVPSSEPPVAADEGAADDDLAGVDGPDDGAAAEAAAVEGGDATLDAAEASGNALDSDTAAGADPLNM
jgi:hypothetical protein